MMKAIRILSVLLVLSITPALLFAQGSAERKKLKKELRTYRKMKPMEIRSMKLSYESRLKDKKSADLRLKNLQRSVDSLQNIVNANNSRVSQLEAQLLAAQSAANNAPKANTPSGYYYRVQLGAFRQYNIKSKKSNDESFNTENEASLNKLTLGLFYSLAEADMFKEDVRRMGVKDAYVVPFKDGKRVTHKEAAEGLRKR